MALLIDGYNLLHASGILPPRHRPRHARTGAAALLNFLSSRSSPTELARTTVVFDARAAPAGWPRRSTIAG